MAKVVVKLKPNIADMRGQTLKRAIESFIEIKDLTCRIGTSYSLEFDAQDQIEALKSVENISQNLLVNDTTEMYEIRSLDEI